MTRVTFGNRGPLLALALCGVFQVPAIALVGGAQRAQGDVARQVVVIRDVHGKYCTGTVLARNIVLTAAHCTRETAGLVVSGGGDAGAGSHAVIAVVTHPKYDARSYAKSQAAVDLALLKLKPEFSGAEPVVIYRRVPLPGERFLVAGFGVTAPETSAGLGTLRTASLVAVDEPSSLQLRLVDPASRGGAVAGLGSCYGDSGGPVFAWRGGRFVLIGVLSWSNGPNMSMGCGGFTGVTPLANYGEWIVQTMSDMSNRLN